MPDIILNVEDKQGNTSKIIVPVSVPAQRRVLWGARVDSNGFIPLIPGLTGAAPFNMAVLDAFENATHMNKKVGWLQWGVGGFMNIVPNDLTKCRNRSIIPHIEMMPSPYTLAQIRNGDADAVIDAFAQKAATWGFPLILRMWWEPNGPWYPDMFDHPEDYAPAWARVFNRIRPVAPNVTFMYCINGFNTALNTNGKDPTPWKIDPAHCDWVGMDTYRNNPITRISDPAINWLKANYPGKPIYWEFGYRNSDANQGEEMLAVLDILENNPNYTDVKAINVFHRNDASASDSLTQRTFDMLRPRIATNFYRASAPLGAAGTRVQPL